MTTLTVRSFVTEQTGGGCTALVLNLKDGSTIVVTDGNLGTDLDHVAAGCECGALLFAKGDWTDGDQPDPALEFHGTSAEVLAWASYVAAS